MKQLLFSLLLIFLVGCNPANKITESEILWDSWGIPHIYGSTDQDLYYMLGWAQMHNHGDLILKLYGEGRGKASEYWQGDFERDVLLHQLGIIESAQKVYRELPQQDKQMVDAFASGINSYAAKHPDAITDAFEVVLPVTPEDVMMHAFRVMYYEFLISDELGTAEEWTPGSNAWAINGPKTAKETTMLLANPHLPWFDFWLFFEAQLTTSENNLYGATLVGLPALGIAFNEHLGWTHTVNTLDNTDLYELTIQNGQYEIDGVFKDFETDSIPLIRNTDGTMETMKVARKRSAFGLVLRESEDKALTLSWPNMDGVFNPIGQWRAMGEAQNLADFKAALKQSALPLFNVIYADDQANILYHFGGNVPRKNGDWEKWQNTVATTSSEELWQGFYTSDEVPSYVNPETHWIQNANDPPYTSTIPPVLKPSDYASHVAPNSMAFRPQRSARLISEASDLTMDDFIRLKHDTRSEMALRLQEELKELRGLSADSLTTAALDDLLAWDTRFDAESKGAILFINVINQTRGKKVFAEDWTFGDPMNTPDGMNDPQELLAAVKRGAEGMQSAFGTLEMPYGDLFRVKVGEQEFPGNGGFGSLGLFRTMNYYNAEDGKYYAYHGDSYVCVTEFGDGVQAKALLSYGNATQSGNPHVGDQLSLYAAKELRDVWFSREAQQAHLERTEKRAEMD